MYMLQLLLLEGVVVQKPYAWGLKSKKVRFTRNQNMNSHMTETVACFDKHNVNWVNKPVKQNFDMGSFMSGGV